MRDYKFILPIFISGTKEISIDFRKQLFLKKTENAKNEQFATDFHEITKNSQNSHKSFFLQKILHLK